MKRALTRSRITRLSLPPEFSVRGLMLLLAVDVLLLRGPLGLDESAGLERAATRLQERWTVVHVTGRHDSEQGHCQTDQNECHWQPTEVRTVVACHREQVDRLRDSQVLEVEPDDEARACTGVDDATVALGLRGGHLLYLPCRSQVHEPESGHHWSQQDERLEVVNRVGHELSSLRVG